MMRAKQILIELLSYTQSNIDKDAMLVSWKNDNRFPVMGVDTADDFLMR